MFSLGLKVPPVVLVLLVAALMWLCALSLPIFKIAIPGRVLLALVLAISGVVISLLGVRSFRKTKTTVNPRKPSSATVLVLSGVYAFTRNPMYLGFLLILAGWAALLSNTLGFLLLPAFVFYMDRFQIAPEERALSHLFGNEFAAYKSRVRRWL
jgi:protein-S-isoprenylcysteine O-methyltransferase Ste14